MTESVQEQRRNGGYLAFAIKTAIVMFIISLGLIFIVTTLVDVIDIQPWKEALRKPFKDEKTRLRLRGLLTTNPAVHYKLSFIEEKRGALGAAIEEIELGIGLLELHSADKAVRQRFAQRLNELRAKMAKDQPK